MKANIHPKWNSEAEVICSCGNIFKAGSTKNQIKVEVCYNCHPYYTGEMKFVDTMGRVERFQKRQKDSVETLKILQEKKKKKLNPQVPHQPKSLREMLLGE